MKIDLDFDGVIANSQLVKERVVREKFGLRIPVAELRKKKVVDGGLMTEEQYSEMGRMAMDGTYPIPPVPDVLLYLPLLVRDGHQLRVVTSRTGKMLKVAKTWLAEHNAPRLPFSGTGYRMPKTEVCKGVDVFVDDDLEKLIPLIGVVPHLLLFSGPLNEHARPYGGIIRVSCWWELYNMVRYDL